MKTRLDKSELWPEKLPNSFTRRVKQTIDYLDKQGLKGRIADCGENNPMKEAIESHFKIKIDSLDWDFNRENTITEKYDAILCFEVLEHVFNPLLFLEQLKKMLADGGIIYLSTPYQYPQFLKAIHHYHEIPADRIIWLYKEAGLKILDRVKVTIAGSWYNHLLGFRPVLRYFQYTRLYKLVAVPK
jgi:SAM-dependent methyltransferase